MSPADLFRERPAAPDRIFFTRSSRTRSGFALFSALTVPFFVVAMVHFAGHTLIGLFAGLLAYVLFFRSMAVEAFRRLWTFHSILLLPAGKELVLQTRRPFRKTESRIPFARIRRVLERTRGTAGRADARSQVLLIVKDGKDVDLGTGSGVAGQALAARFAFLTGAPQEVERVPDFPIFPSNSSGNGSGFDAGP